ncbi:MAG: hypothetical protein ACRDAM_01805 [Casimicrobium sp.]
MVSFTPARLAKLVALSPGNGLIALAGSVILGVTEASVVACVGVFVLAVMESGATEFVVVVVELAVPEVSAL